MIGEASSGAVTELAAMLARGCVRLLAARAEKVRTDAVFSTKNPQNPVDVVAGSCRNCGGQVKTEDACKPICRSRKS